MTEEDVHVVETTEGVIPVEQLVQVQGTTTGNILLTTTTYVLGVTADRSHKVGLPLVEYVVSQVCGELEVLQEGPLEVAT